MSIINLYSTDYVILADGEPLESLDVIYSVTEVIKLINTGFALEKNEKFVAMTDLSDELKARYVKELDTVGEPHLYIFDPKTDVAYKAPRTLELWNDIKNE
jgi:hypothetical protein